MSPTIGFQFFALTVLAQLCIANATVQAQQTDRRFLLGGGIVPLSFAHSKINVSESPPEQTKTSTRTGLGDDVLLTLGYGIGSWVIALESALSYSVDSYGADITTASTDEDALYTELQIGPSLRYLFNESGVRWFLEAGAGLGSAVSSTNTAEADSRTLYVRGGPGLQIRLADPVSLDLALRLGYATTSAEVEVTADNTASPVNRASRRELTTALTDYSIAETTVDMSARLSIWL